MENFGKSRIANISFDNTLSSVSLNSLKINGSSSGHDIKSSAKIKEFSRNIYNDQKLIENYSIPVFKKNKNSDKTKETYTFVTETQTIETKRENTKIYDEIIDRPIINKINRTFEEKIEKNSILDQENEAEMKNINIKKITPELNENNNNQNKKKVSKIPKLLAAADTAFPKLTKHLTKETISDKSDDEKNYEHKEKNYSENKKSNLLIIPEPRTESSQIISTDSNQFNKFQSDFEETLKESVSSLNHVFLPIASDMLLKCCVKRSTNRLSNYTMYLEKQDKSYQKLLIGHTVSKLPKTYIKIYAVKTGQSESLVFLGKLKANVTNNEFSLKCLVNVSDAFSEDINDGPPDSELYEEHLNIIYRDASLFSVNKIQQFTFITPINKILSRANYSRFSTKSNLEIFIDKYSNKTESNENDFMSKMPKFNEKKGSYTLNFNGEYFY